MGRIRRCVYDTNLDLIVKMVDRELDGAKLVDVAIERFKTAYLAVRTPAGHVTAAVAKLTYAPGVMHYSITRESELPKDAACHRRILSLLTPVEDAYQREVDRHNAQNWRTQCRHALHRRTNPKRLKDGDVIRTAHPLHFTDGAAWDTFVVTKERTLRGGTSTSYHLAVETYWGWEVNLHSLYRLPRLTKVQYEVVGNINDSQETVQTDLF